MTYCVIKINALGCICLSWVYLVYRPFSAVYIRSNNITWWETMEWGHEYQGQDVADSFLQRETSFLFWKKLLSVSWPHKSSVDWQLSIWSQQWNKQTNSCVAAGEQPEGLEVQALSWPCTCPLGQCSIQLSVREDVINKWSSLATGRSNWVMVSGAKKRRLVF